MKNMKSVLFLACWFCCHALQAIPTVSMLGVNRTEGTESDVISAADYIQDGLVAMWDGIENAGWWCHDSSAQVWTDLVGGKILRPYTVDFPFSWENKSCKFKHTIQTTIPLNTALGCSVEICIYHPANDFFGNPPNLLWIQANSAGYLGVSAFGYGSGWNLGNKQSAAGRKWHTVLYGTTHAMTARCVYDGERMVFTYNDLQAPAYLDTVLEKEEISTKIGRLVLYNYVYSVRIYNRVLTDEEVIHNYEVDCIRFDLPQDEE